MALLHCQTFPHTHMQRVRVCTSAGGCLFLQVSGCSVEMLQLAEDIISGPLAKLISSPLFASVLQGLRYCGEGVGRGGRWKGRGDLEYVGSCIIFQSFFSNSNPATLPLSILPPHPPSHPPSLPPSLPSSPILPPILPPSSLPSSPHPPFHLTYLILSFASYSSPTSSLHTSSPPPPFTLPPLHLLLHFLPHNLLLLHFPFHTPPSHAFPLPCSHTFLFTHLPSHTPHLLPIYWSLQVLLGTSQCLPLGKEGPALPPKPHLPSSGSKHCHLWAAMCSKL